MLEAGDYRYDPHEYHGPSLNYLSLPGVWLSGARDRRQVSTRHLRRLPAGMGVLLVLWAWRLRGSLGAPATAVVAALTASSPALVFYSRDYIQEMLLVTFTMAVLSGFWRWQATVAAAATAPPASGVRGAGWLEVLLLGLSGGMMLATKETWVLAGFALAVAAWCSCDLCRRPRRWPWAQLGAALFLSPELEPLLADYLYARPPAGQRRLYVPVAPPGRTHYLLPPGVPLRIFVRQDLLQVRRPGHDTSADRSTPSAIRPQPSSGNISSQTP